MKSLILYPIKDGSVRDQTLDVFDQASIYFPSVIRMWVYLKDIDNNYKEFSDARNQVYSDNGITNRYFVSTCVEPVSLPSNKTIVLKLLLCLGLKKTQLTYMDLFCHLPHTKTYDVCFERGVKIDFDSETHYHIAGTASINSTGQVLYPGDVKKQTRRVYTVIENLLKKYEADEKDIKSLHWYVRNPSDISDVEKIIDDLGLFSKNISHTIEEAKICRKQWLVEAECFAKIEQR